MPNRDGTGPEGKGYRTGKGLGNCDPDKSSKKNKFLGKGLGKGRRRNKGQGNQPKSKNR